MKRIGIALSAACIGMLLSLSGCGGGDSAGTVTLLNVSYDPTRELYREINESFAREWQQRTQERVTIRQSHGGSGSQARAVIDARMTGRVTVTAGPHDVGFTWKERPFQPQDVWQPSLRATQEAHNPSGLPRLETVSIAGPYDPSGISDTAP